jgi:hypothetical protein
MARNAAGWVTELRYYCGGGSTLEGQWLSGCVSRKLSFSPRGRSSGTADLGESESFLEPKKLITSLHSKPLQRRGREKVGEGFTRTRTDAASRSTSPAAKPPAFSAVQRKLSNPMDSSSPASRASSPGVRAAIRLVWIEEVKTVGTVVTQRHSLRSHRPGCGARRKEHRAIILFLLGTSAREQGMLGTLRGAAGARGGEERCVRGTWAEAR